MSGKPKPLPTTPTPTPKPPMAKPPTPTPPGPAPLAQAQQSAFDLMNQTLASWGLQSLAADVRKFIIQGDTDQSTLALALSQTDAYKQRFAGNAARVKNGLPELTPAQYIALEEQYKNVLQSYGLPAGFYDSQKDFTDFIGKDLSPSELQTRAQIAHDQYTAAPAYMKELWGQYFGSKGDAIAAIIDPDTATAVIQDRAKQVQIGGAAAAQGMSVSQQRAQQFAQAGVTLDQARQAYQQIAAIHNTDQSIARRFGQTFTQADEENDLLLGNGDAALKRQSLYANEKALFHGSGGLDQSALGVAQIGG